MIGGNEYNFFKFVWKIENWRMHHLGDIDSPKFVIKKFLNTLWYLTLRRSNTREMFPLECILVRVEASDGPEEIQIHFNIVLGDNPNELTEHANEQTETFKKGSYKNYNNFSSNKNQRWLYSSDFIYIICLMSVDADKINKTISDNASIFYSNSCIARTVFSINRKTITWSMGNILNSSKMDYFCFVTEDNIKIPGFSINIRVNEENTIVIKIKAKENKDMWAWAFKKLMYNVCILDIEENICCSTDKWNETEGEKWDLEFTLETKDLLPEQPAFELKTCRLCLEIATNETGHLSWIDRTSPVNLTNLNCNNQAIDGDRLKMKNSSKRFCDVTLQFPNKKFKVPKTLLCENSPVFSAMFETDMMESKSNTIDIEDIDEKTMDSMLNFLEYNTLEDNPFEDVLKLYTAADKYSIRSLQEKCALSLQSKITLVNALPLLLLSDTIGDKKLKFNVLRYVVEHFSNIVLSQAWRLFSKDNSMLAIEVLERAYIKATGIQRN